MKRWIVLAAAAGAAALAPAPSLGATTFPGCGSTVQSCIDAAAPGDTLILATAGPIVGPLDLKGKSLRLEAGPGFEPLVQGGIIAFGGSAPTHISITGLTVEGRIIGGPGTGNLTLDVADCTVHSASIFGAAIELYSPGSEPFGDFDFNLTGNRVDAVGNGDSAQCSGIFYGGVYDTGEAHGTIVGNLVATSACGQGGGIRVAPSNEESLDVAILGNRVAADGSSNGILLRGSPAGATATVAGNLVTGNKSVAGATGALVASASGGNARLEVVLVNNTVAFNQDGLILDARTDLGASISGLVANNIVANNARNGLVVDDAVAATVTLVDNLVFGNKVDHFSGAGTLAADPRFVGAPDDLRLAADSPAVNSGDNGAVPAELGADLAGQTRIAGGTVDRGAYEYQGPFLPGAPSQLRAEAVSTSAIRLDWVDGASNEDDFVIERWNGAAFVFAGTAPADATSGEISGLAADTEYTFRVRARNAGGSSAPSNEATARTLPAIPPPAAPIQLVATLVGRDRVRLDWSDQSSDELGFRVERRGGTSSMFVTAAKVGADSRTVEIAGLRAGTLYGFRVVAFNGGGDSAPSNVAEATTPAGCQPSDTVACLGDRFAVTADWRTADGATGEGHAGPLTQDSTSFWFFSRDNVELMVKVLDGCSVNQRFWVFATGLTDVGVRLVVTDTWTGKSEVYDNPQGRPFAPIQDTGALAACGFAASTRPEPPAATQSGCAAGDELLCVQGGRFHVEALWRTADGQRGRGHAVALSAESGYFWFFDPANIELVTKVLDGCAAYDRFWVFAGGLTDVEVELRVTDVETGVVRTYRNPIGQPYRPLQDTDAFPTCR